jgi:hypothetical protein
VSDLKQGLAVLLADAAADEEVLCVVDRGLGGQRPACLELLLDLGALVVHLEGALDAAADHLGVEASGGVGQRPAAGHDRDAVRPAQREPVARLLEPPPAGPRAVEHPGVRELELANGELVAVAAAAVAGAEGRGKARQPAAPRALDLPDRETAGDLGQRLGVVGGAKAVVERLEADSPPLRLAPGPSWPVR